jgi:c-di-GMP-binding flagellar brake protein YcgR
MASTLVKNRRRFPRVSAVLHVTYYIDGDIIPATTENISRGGMRILTPRLIPSSEVLEFIIIFNKRPVETRGRLVYLSHDRTRAGIRFENVLNVAWERSLKSSGQNSLDLSMDAGRS